MKKIVYLHNPALVNTHTGSVEGTSGKLYGRHTQGKFSMPFEEYQKASRDLCRGTGINAGRWIVEDIKTVDDEGNEVQPATELAKQLQDALTELDAVKKELESKPEATNPKESGLPLDLIEILKPLADDSDDSPGATLSRVLKEFKKLKKKHG